MNEYPKPMHLWRSWHSKAKTYWSLVKSPQTILLLVTGLAGYSSARCPVITWQVLGSLAGSLFLTIAGSTVLNMVLDRDLDRLMQRTCTRPLPAERLTPAEAAVFGIGLSILGIGWALQLSPLYGLLVAAGLFFDVVIYTLWLKRRTAWSIVWGGIAGGMPVLAGRALGVGRLEWIGLALAIAVLFWIPTHIMTFNMRYKRDYQLAGIPTFPSQYGNRITRITIVVSSVVATVAMGVAAVGIGMAWGYLRLLGVLAAGMLLLAINSLLRPSPRLNFALFKYASAFMLSAMALVMLETLG